MRLQPDAQNSPQNAAMANNRGGADLLGLFGAAFNLLRPKRSGASEKEKYRPWNPGEKISLENRIRAKFDDDYFKRNFMIPAHKISDFLEFCGEQGIKQELLRPEMEMDLIQYLMEQSSNYGQFETSD